ncbi:MAG: hypothetical protein EON54_28460 [Alcaligenaceae bacterium]|nr:MAG: hypothetical protein EON54_28460 [Alcaligenaceae bacterium]
MLASPEREELAIFLTQDDAVRGFMYLVRRQESKSLGQPFVCEGFMLKPLGSTDKDTDRTRRCLRATSNYPAYCSTQGVIKLTKAVAFFAQQSHNSGTF